MKNALLASFLIIGTSVFGQKIYIGPELGMNLIQLESKDYGKNYHPGVYTGGAFQYKFTDWLGLRSGIYYSNKRQAYTSADTSSFDFFGLIDSSGLGIDGLNLNTYTSTYGRTSQHYLEIPVMASFDWKGLNVNIGAYAGFMFTARKRETVITETPFIQVIDVASLLGLDEPDTTGGGGFGGIGGGFGGFGDLISSFLPDPYSEEFSEETDKSGMRLFDYGIKGSIGYQPGNFGVFAGYQFGIPDYRTSPEGDRQRHSYLQFSVSYMFGIGKKDLGNSHM